jgi:hypothetical protein
MGVFWVIHSITLDYLCGCCFLLVAGVHSQFPDSDANEIHAKILSSCSSQDRNYYIPDAGASPRKLFKGF